MMKNLNHVFRISLVVALIAGAWAGAEAQKYPVQVNTQLMPPFTPYLSDYTAVGSQRLLVNFMIRDLTLPDYRCKLRITIEGVGITIRTKPTYIPRQPLILPGGGIPYQVYGEEIEEYFNPENLDFVGITRAQFTKGARLPAGVYRFSIEALDYNRGTVVSNRGTATAWIVLNDPPILNLPRAETKVKIIDPTNIPFSWTPRHTGSPNAAFTTEYIFRLVEIWPANRNPYDAFLSQQPLYETTTANTQIIYGMAEPALLPGRKYAWQVQAVDVEGRDLFKNQGKSEVFVFQFGDLLGVPENFRKEGGNASVLNVRWEPAQTGAAPQQYRLRYRAKNADKGAWFENVTDQPWATVTALKPETEYELQVRAEAIPQYSEYSSLYTVRTEAATVAAYACGTEGDIPAADNSTILPILRVNDVITLRNFEVTVTELGTGGGNGDYTGKGWMKMPWFNGGSVLVEFKGHMNDQYQLVTGEFKSVYNKGSAAAQVIEDAHNIGKEPEPQPADSSATEAPPYVVGGTIDSVYVKDDGKIVVVDTDGKESTFDPRTDASGKPQETVVSDSAGNSYTVDEGGKVTKNERGDTNASVGGNAGGKKTKRNLLREIVSRQLTEIKQETQKHGK